MLSEGPQVRPKHVLQHYIINQHGHMFIFNCFEKFINSVCSDSNNYHNYTVSLKSRIKNNQFRHERLQFFTSHVFNHQLHSRSYGKIATGMLILKDDTLAQINNKVCSPCNEVTRSHQLRSVVRLDMLGLLEAWHVVLLTSFLQLSRKLPRLGEYHPRRWN